MFWALTHSAHAAEWYFDPSIGAGTQYSDNPRLTTGEHGSIMSFSTEPVVRFGFAQPRHGFSGNAVLKSQIFFGGSGEEDSDELDRNSVALNFSTYYRTRSDSFTLGAGFGQSSTLDIDEEEGTVISEDVTRETISFRSSWSHTLSERMNMNLGFSTSSTTLERSGGSVQTGFCIGAVPGATYPLCAGGTAVPPFNPSTITRPLNDSKNHSFNASIAHTLTPTTSAQLALSYSLFEPETNLDSETVSLQLGASGSLGPTWSYSFLAGQRFTSSAGVSPIGFCIGADPGATFPECTGGLPRATTNDLIIVDNLNENNGATYSAHISKIFESGDITASASLAASASGSLGQLQESTNFRLSGRYSFSERLSTRVGLSFTESEQLGGITFFGNNHTEYFVFTPTLTYQLTKKLRGNIAYVFERSDNEDGIATGNSIGMNINYNPNQFSLSR